MNGNADVVQIESYSRVWTFLKGPWPVFLLLALFWWMAVSSQADKSAAFDELPHLTAGYTYWLTNDYRLQPENGNLSQRWVALPLLFGRYNLPLDNMPGWKNAMTFIVGHSFLYKLANDANTILFSGRAMMATMAVGLGLLVYGWARSLFGHYGGLISLWLFTFCPSMLAYGSLTTSDLPVSLFLTAAVWSFWAMLQQISVSTILLSAIAIAAACLSKLSGMAVLPIATFLILIRLTARRPLRVSILRDFLVEDRMRRLAWMGLALAVQTAVVVTIFWSFYGFRYTAFRTTQSTDVHFEEPWEAALARVGNWSHVIQSARDHHMLPEAFLYQLTYVIGHEGKRQAFLNGDYRQDGWWYFFPYAALVKTPLPLFLLLAIAGTGVAWSRRLAPTGIPLVDDRGKFWYATAPLWVLLAVYWSFALTSHLNIGHRHILPTYPAMFVLAGTAALWLRLSSTIIMKGIVLACLMWFMIESFGIRPHYLAYFNQIAGGPVHGYRHLVDSSLDWGQDLPGLKRWLRQQQGDNQGQNPVLLGYFGVGSPEYYGINARLLPSFSIKIRSASEEALKPLPGGIYCISATTLQGLYSPYWGPWKDSYEKMYLKLLDEVTQYTQLKDDLERLSSWVEEHGGPQMWPLRLKLFDGLRATRLMAYLRKRDPDDHVGYSILIYRLTDEQVREAVHGPAPY